MTEFENALVGAAFGRVGATGAEARAAEVLDLISLRPLANAKAGALTHVERKWPARALALATDTGLLLPDEIAGG